MDQNSQTDSAMTRARAVLAGAAGAFVMFAASVVLPPIGFFAGLLAPFPAVLNHVRYGRMTGITIVLAVTTALTAVFGISAGALYLLQCGAVSLVMPELIVRGHRPGRIIVWTTACSVSLLAGAMALYSLLSGHHIHQILSDEITASLTQAMALYEKSGVTGDELAQVKRSMEAATALMVRIYPALTTLLLALMTGCNVALMRRPAARLGYVSAGQFSEFRVPEPLIWLLIAAGFSLLAPDRALTTPALNVMVVLVALYFLQGLAVIITITGRHALSRVLRLLFYALLLLQPYVAGVVAIIGIFDLWGDFRTPGQKANL
jgi:uncharacterized protein YybS (DUF2232 family)